MNIEIDPALGIFTIAGINYAYDFFAGLGVGQLGTVFEVVARKDGTVTLKTISVPAANAEKVETRG
jgi:hypothetical protein